MGGLADAARADARRPAPPLRFKVYENALLVPSPSRSEYRDIDGGLLDADLRPVPEALLTRTWGQISYVPAIDGLDMASVEVVEEPHIYGGYFFDHFGHFLLESLARSWVVEDVGPLPFAWAAGGQSSPWQADLLALLGLTMRHRFPTGPTRFRELIVPDPGFRIQGMFHPRHARFLARYEASTQPTEPFPKVWLSRANVLPTRRSRGEEHVQEVLRQDGWSIRRPEHAPLSEQLETLATAGVVAGLEGSAFHAAILLKSPVPPLLILRKTRNTNYRSIADQKGILELDLYGAYRLHDRREDVSLTRPRETALVVAALAQQIERKRSDPAALLALRSEFEARYDFETWRRRQRWRVAAHLRVHVHRSVRYLRSVRYRIFRAAGLYRLLRAAGRYPAARALRNRVRAVRRRFRRHT